MSAHAQNSLGFLVRDDRKMGRDDDERLAFSVIASITPIMYVRT